MKKNSLGLAVVLVLSLAHAPLLAQAPAAKKDAKKPAAKQDAGYPGYGRKWAKDFGVAKGGCDGAAIGAVKDRSAAVLRGETKLDKLDAGDRGCIAHSLELAGEKKTVAWTNKKTGLTYRLTPTRTFKRDNAPCREFTIVSSADKKQDTVNSVACRSGDGEWNLKR